MANIQSKELFKFQVEQQARTKKNNQIKLRKPSPWLTPISSERVYEKEIKKILNRFIQITIQNIKPLLREWNRQNIILKEDINDDPIDDLENIDLLFEKEQNEIFNTNIDITKAAIYGIALNMGDFNRKQWSKILKKSLNVEFILIEAWEDTILKEWVTRNVNLIKGITNEYRKKINEAVLSAWNTGQTAESLAKELTKINKAFATGDWKRDSKGKIIRINDVPVRKQSRANLIARDQINKLNGTYTKKRQEDAGVDWYIWNTAADERVRGRPGGKWATARPSHWAMERKICRWDDSTVYADSIGDAKAGNWKSRASIGAVQLHPGNDINCRCFGSPVFSDIVEEVNKEIKS